MDVETVEKLIEIYEAKAEGKTYPFLCGFRSDIMDPSYNRQNDEDSPIIKFLDNVQDISYIFPKWVEKLYSGNPSLITITPNQNPKSVRWDMTQPEPQPPSFTAKITKDGIALIDEYRTEQAKKEEELELQRRGVRTAEKQTKYSKNANIISICSAIIAVGALVVAIIALSK